MSARSAEAVARESFMMNPGDLQHAHSIGDCVATQLVRVSQRSFIRSHQMRREGVGIKGPEF